MACHFCRPGGLAMEIIGKTGEARDHMRVAGAGAIGWDCPY